MGRARSRKGPRSARKIAKNAKTTARRAGPLAEKYVAVITWRADVSGDKAWQVEEGGNMREVLRAAKRSVRAALDGIVDAPRATIDLHADDKDGKLLQQLETHQSSDTTGFIRFRALEV